MGTFFSNYKEDDWERSVAVFLTFSAFLKVRNIDKFTTTELIIVSIYLRDIFDKNFGFDIELKNTILASGLIEEKKFEELTASILSFVDGDFGEKLTMLFKISEIFSKYRDNIVIDYDSAINQLLEELYGDIAKSKDNIEKIIQIMQELSDYRADNISFKTNSFLEGLLQKIKTTDLQPVRLPLKEERILLSLVFMRYLKDISERDRIVLSLLIADALYLIWLYKENLINDESLKIGLEKIVNNAIQYTSNRELVFYFETYLFVVWNAIVHSSSLVEELTAEKLNEISEELAIKVIFGSEENYEETKKIIQDFLISVMKDKPKDKVKWLKEKLKNDYGIILTQEEEEIIEKQSNEGLEFSEQVSIYSESQIAKYISDIDKVLEESNKELMKYADYKDSFGLHGELAEEWHAKTFNIDAAVKRKNVEAVVLKRNTKNSVDIRILDESGKECRRYQLKYGKNAKVTASYLEEGNYKGQRPLVPSDQVEEVTEIRVKSGKSPAVDRLEYDGVESKPLSREEAERLKEKVRKRLDVFNWEETVTFKEVFKEVCKDVGRSFMLLSLIKGAVRLGKGIFSSNTSIKQEFLEFLKEDLKENVISSLKVALSGAILVSARKGFIKFLQNIPPARILMFVETGFRSLKIIKGMVTGDIPLSEGVKQIVVNTAKIASSMYFATAGATIGGAIGSFIPVVGTVIGGFIGGVLGALFGETVVNTSVKVVSEVRRVRSKILQWGYIV